MEMELEVGHAEAFEHPWQGGHLATLESGPVRILVSTLPVLDPKSSLACLTFCTNCSESSEALAEPGRRQKAAPA